MLAQWMLRRHLEPVRADCRVERSDAVDLAAVCAMEMRGWYLDHLAKGPAELLAPEDVAGESEAEAAADGQRPDNSLRQPHINRIPVSRRCPSGWPGGSGRRLS